MALATVERVEGRLVLSLSEAAQRELDLKEGSTLDVQRLHETLLVKARKYTLDELLAQCDYSLPMSDEERDWVDAPAVGRELI